MLVHFRWEPRSDALAAQPGDVSDGLRPVPPEDADAAPQRDHVVPMLADDEGMDQLAPDAQVVSDLPPKPQRVGVAADPNDPVPA